MIWRDDFSASTFEDVMRCLAENIVWSRQLRSDRTAATAKRLSKQITFEEYQAIKKEAKARSNGNEDDGRERRDKNLERSGREKSGDQKRLMDKDDDYRDRMHDFSRLSASHKDEGNGSSRSDRSRSRDRSSD